MTETNTRTNEGRRMGRKKRKFGEWRRYANGCGYAAVSTDGDVWPWTFSGTRAYVDGNVRRWVGETRVMPAYTIKRVVMEVVS